MLFTEINIHELTRIDADVSGLIDLENHWQNANIHAFLALIGDGAGSAGAAPPGAAPPGAAPPPSALLSDGAVVPGQEGPR